MGLQGPGTKQGVIERNIHCKPANEVTRYPEKSHRGWLLEFQGTFYYQLSENGSQLEVKRFKRESIDQI